MAKNSNSSSKDSNASNQKPKGNNKRRRPNGAQRDKSPREEHLETRNNDPRWYFFDEKIADQVSQMSFQNLAGYPIQYDSEMFDVPNIVGIFLNPSPGVQTSRAYNTALAQNSGMNLAAFRLYSKLSAFTGRTQAYAPQDLATMILAMGDVISQFEFIRRAFGVAYTMNMRNRDYPRQVLNFGMLVDADDLFKNFSDYRTRFNALVTLFNQIPIPRNVAYFDKCAALYERIYVDAPSSMAQTLIPNPYTVWQLDEQSYSGGTVLKTTPWCCNSAWGYLNSPQLMSAYLATLEQSIGLLLNSSSLQIVYSDIMNYAAKNSFEFWRQEYLLEGYQVLPEYDQNFLLQMHNATICAMPLEPTFQSSPVAVTPLNDVYPDPNKNCIYYNPAFRVLTGTSKPRTGNDVLIDMLTDTPSLTDRVEVTRYAGVCNGTAYTTSDNYSAYIDTALPDHYIVVARFEQQTTRGLSKNVTGTLITDPAWKDIAAQIANIDWAPRIFELDSNGNYTGRYTGDVNFYTVVDSHYLRKLHDFVGLALYDVR